MVCPQKILYLLSLISVYCCAPHGKIVFFNHLSKFGVLSNRNPLYNKIGRHLFFYTHQYNLIQGGGDYTLIFFNGNLYNKHTHTRPYHTPNFCLHFSFLPSYCQIKPQNSFYLFLVIFLLCYIRNDHEVFQIRFIYCKILFLNV